MSLSDSESTSSTVSVEVGSAVRAEAVARGRARLADPTTPSAIELAAALVDRLVTERSCRVVSYTPS